MPLGTSQKSANVLFVQSQVAQRIRSRCAVSAPASSDAHRGARARAQLPRLATHCLDTHSTRPHTPVLHRRRLVPSMKNYAIFWGFRVTGENDWGLKILVQATRVPWSSTPEIQYNFHSARWTAAIVGTHS